ncbi:TRAP transporter substrate-binding protein [Propionivibrio sp.]|uniref:TRAP transporter substrate-binding protein n=1 Tax=Propionivibrio sp. TaxID=2212460 RepID=UPI00272EE0CC|nr:TRAP transporter substrate-binding protein DctP [Propionivibrio sp.]
MKKLVISSLLAVSALSLTFPAAAQEAIKLKLGHVAPTDEPYHQAAEKFAELVKKNTGGAVEIQIFPNSLLGGQRELLEGLQLGSVDITLTTAAVLSSFLPKTQVIELPFMFRDSEHVYKVVDGPLAKEIYAGDEKKKMKVIDTWENGFRNITNNVRPIETPDDMKGVKIRVMENKMYIEMFKALGANPTPMARGELFTGLQTKVVDGQENPLGQIYTSRFYEVQKYATLSGHTYSPEAVVFSLASWKKIPAKYQEEILKASAEAKKFNRELSAKMDKEYVGKLEEKGMTVTKLTPQQIAAFQEKMMPVWDLFADKIGKDLIQKIKDTK